MKKRTAVILCVVVSLLVISICVAAYFATFISRYSLGAVTQISINDNQSSTYVLQIKYLFASGGYSVRNVPENEGEYTGDGMKDYDGALGEYRILVQFGDLALEDSFNKMKDEKGMIHLSKDFRARVAYPSDHGFVLYVGCDKPMRIETLEGVRLNPFGGTIKIPISIVDINPITNQLANDPSASGKEPSLHIQPPDNIFPVHFTGYYDYIACFTGELDLAIVEPEVREYVQRVMSGQSPLMIPRCAAVPLPLREEEAICIFPTETYGWLWTWFYTQIGQARVIIRVSELSEAHRTLAQGKTCSQFIAEIAPDAPNVGNYNEQFYSSVTEATLRIGGRDVLALISETKTDKTGYIEFLWDGFLITISAPSGVVTESWLETLSFGKITLVGDLKAKTLTNALQQCNTGYDYTQITYDMDKEAWKVGFWENSALLAAQTIMIDETGTINEGVTCIQWAE